MLPFFNINHFKMITTNQEDYLRAMYHIWEENNQIAKIKNKEVIIKSNEIAEYLNVTKPSVSKMMGELSNKGLVKFERYGSLEFTKKGKETARNIIAKHRIIELFLKNKLKINEKKIHELAHKLEHAFDDECVQKLRTLLGNPKQDPHGKLIPAQ